MSDKTIIYYLNQFFGQVGGEEKAGMAPELREGVVGPALAFNEGVKEVGQVSYTLICGDNFFNEHNEEALAFLDKVYADIQPDLVVAGPAFNAGRYGMACQGVAKFFNDKDIPVISGLYEENPGLEETRKFAYVVPTGDSAASMRQAIPVMVELAKKLLKGETVRPETDGYFAQGKRLTVITEKNGAQRAVEMLMKRLNNQAFETELPMPHFDEVEPAAAIKDLKTAKIALVTTGGIVPLGNPDRIQSASAQKWGKYDVSALDELTGDYCTIHGGYDPVYANEIPDRVVPLDALRQMQKEGIIGEVYKDFYTTTGTGTAVGNAIKFGQEIGKELAEAGVDGVILTST